MVVLEKKKFKSKKKKKKVVLRFYSDWKDGEGGVLGFNFVRFFIGWKVYRI